MAPVKPKGASTRLARKTAAGPSKSAKVVKRPPPKQVKTKPASATLAQSNPKKKKKPQYTDSQLNLPALNSIVPASATAAQRSGKGTGKKKNKVYIDDQESMMTILAMVNADKEGVIESKMIKERQLEEIREARRKEAEKRAGEKKGKFEEVKKELKKGNKQRSNQNADSSKSEGASSASKTKKDATASDSKKKRKSVSFA